MVAFPKLLLLWTAFFMLAMGLPALFSPKVFSDILGKTLKNLDIIRVRSFITMIIGLLFLSVYRKFDNGRAIFFSIFGRSSMIKGLFLLRFPAWGQRKYKWFYATRMGCICTGLLILLFSLFTIRVACVKF